MKLCLRRYLNILYKVYISKDSWENDTKSVSRKKAVIVIRIKESVMQWKHGRCCLIKTNWESLYCREISVILDKTFDGIWNTFNRFRMFCKFTKKMSMTRVIVRILQHFSEKCSQRTSPSYCLWFGLLKKFVQKLNLFRRFLGSFLDITLQFFFFCLILEHLSFGSDGVIPSDICVFRNFPL